MVWSPAWAAYATASYLRLTAQPIARGQHDHVAVRDDGHPHGRVVVTAVGHRDVVGQGAACQQGPQRPQIGDAIFNLQIAADGLTGLQFAVMPLPVVNTQAAEFVTLGPQPVEQHGRVQPAAMDQHGSHRLSGRSPPSAYDPLAAGQSPDGGMKGVRASMNAGY